MSAMRSSVGVLCWMCALLWGALEGAPRSSLSGSTAYIITVQGLCSKISAHLEQVQDEYRRAEEVECSRLQDLLEVAGVQSLDESLPCPISKVGSDCSPVMLCVGAILARLRIFQSLLHALPEMASGSEIRKDLGTLQAELANQFMAPSPVTRAEGSAEARMSNALRDQLGDRWDRETATVCILDRTDFAVKIVARTFHLLQPCRNSFT
ncbi:uncharacterized protein LOC133358228 [Lethenteron reissneri]|uniref:uncharacterized protein LOC133358228 n=1 Tax=Lethenteron reissneri TaxID=7753 RepID=UPI002AB7CAB8|nr:uncharacterized protein LOC133358228 [Lethenteron reissneri]